MLHAPGTTGPGVNWLGYLLPSLPVAHATKRELRHQLHCSLRKGKAASPHWGVSCSERHSLSEQTARRPRWREDDVASGNRAAVAKMMPLQEQNVSPIFQWPSFCSKRRETHAGSAYSGAGMPLSCLASACNASWRRSKAFAVAASNCALSNYGSPHGCTMAFYFGSALLLT
jgi:hypothetical protein